MTKSDLQASLAAQIGGVGLVTKVRHQAYDTDAISEIYPDTITDTQSTTNLITKAGTNFNYSFTFWKSGRTVFVTGIIRNATFGNITAQNIASGLSGDFAPAADTYYMAFDNSTTNRMNITFDADGNLKLINTITTQNDFIVNAHYATLN